MSRLEDLIKELCPNGVRLRALGGMIIRGDNVQINKDIAQKTGEYPVINSAHQPLGYCNTYNNLGNSVVITSHGEPGYAHWLETPFLAGSLCYPMRSRNENELLSKFIYYWLQNEEESIREKFVNSAGVPYLNARNFFASPIPVPPLEVQKRIVWMLDKFMELEAELKAELGARKTQYEYYRRLLLDFNMAGQDVNCKALGGMIIRGDNVQINKDIAQKTGEYPVINSAHQPLGYCNTYNNLGNSVVITSHGEPGYAHWLETPFLAGSLCYPMRSRNENELLSKFIYYWLQNEEESIREKFVNSAGVPYLNARNFFASPIPVPPLEVQKRIVWMLDKFSTLINDTSSGIPAEIRLRHLQYEYCRNKLLTFNQVA